MNNRFIINDDNQLIDISTGEVIDRKQIRDAYQNKIIDTYGQFDDELISIGSGLELKVMKYRGVDYNVVTIKKNYTFGKVFRMGVRELMKEQKLSKNAKVFIATFEPYISFPHNSIVVDGKNPNIDVMCEMCDLKRTAMYGIIKELESYEVIKKIKLNGDIIIYFNPFLYCSGGVIHKDTYELFKDSRYNTNTTK